MASSFFFNGQLYTTPAVVSAVNDTAEAPIGNTVGNVLALIGQSTGGEPGVALSFSNPTDAANTLLSGELLVAVQKAFAPSSQTNAPSTVIAIRVGEATQAALTLKDSSANNVIALTSAQYGQTANLTKVQVTEGSSTGVAVIVQNGNTYYEQDNLARNAFTVQYAGGNASAQMTVANATVTLYSPAGTQVASIDLTVYTTVSALADAISAVAGFTATPVAGNENTAALNGLDSVTLQDVKTALYTATANLQAVIDWLNGPTQTLVTATRVANAGKPPALMTSFAYLSGGTSPAPVMLDWTNALSALQSVDVQWVVCLTSLPAVWAAQDAHCQFMSQAGQKERRGFVGPGTGTSIAAAEAIPVTIDSDRTAVIAQGYWDYDASGVLTLYEPYMTAAVVAAGFAGLSPGYTMTNKSIKVVGLEWSPRDPTDTTPMINAGVIPLESTPSGFMVVRAVSSWLQNNNFNRVEISCGAAVDYTVRTVRNALAQLKGGRGDPTILGQATSLTETALMTLAVPPPAGPGTIVGDNNSPAFQNITASLTGDAIEVAFVCSPVIPVNFVGITASIVPYSGSASAAVTTTVTTLAAS
jgi:hypothetical protein